MDTTTRPGCSDLEMHQSAGPDACRRRGRRAAGLALAVAAMVAVVDPGFARAQSRTGSQAASELIAEGSVLVASGSAELLSAGGELVVVAVRRSAHGVELVLRPVGGALSEAAATSATVTVELSATAWEAAVEAGKASGRAVGASAGVASGLVVAVPLTASASGLSATVVGSALVAGDVVLGIVAEDVLAGMLGRETHRCATHGP